MHNANLRRIRKFVPQNSLIYTYKSTVEPIVNCGCTVWGYASAHVLNVISLICLDYICLDYICMFILTAFNTYLVHCFIVVL